MRGKMLMKADLVQPKPDFVAYTNVSFIPFLVFGFWSLLATKLRKYENIT